jgi:hypothetical protein
MLKQLVSMASEQNQWLQQILQQLTNVLLVILDVPTKKKIIVQVQPCIMTGMGIYWAELSHDLSNNNSPMLKAAEGYLIS